MGKQKPKDKKPKKTRLEKTPTGKWVTAQPRRAKPKRTSAKNIGQESRGGVGKPATKYKPMGKPGKKKVYGKLKGAAKSKRSKR